MIIPIVPSLVVFSLILQAFLFATAGMRRRNQSTVLRVALWLAYLLADSVATYTLGHISIATSSDDFLLVSFWTPFLLLHLGGPDTITAYALEDNRLWLRHLESLGLQVLAAVYIIISYSSVGGGWALITATVLMFIVGTLKYGERIWALKCASNDGMYSFLMSYCSTRNELLSAPVPPDYEEAGSIVTEEERVMYGAHSLLGVSLCIFLDREEETCRHNNGALSVLAYLVSVDETNDTRVISIYTVIEMQLSLMYDIMYTKARVIHTRYGFWIRVFSLLALFATVILVSLFVDKEYELQTVVDITYTLLAGAIVIEIASGFVAIVSTWTRHQLCTPGWKRRLFYPIVVSLRGLVNAVWWRSSLATIGQFNMIECSDQEQEQTSCMSLQCLAELFIDSDEISELPDPVQVPTHMERSILVEILRVTRECGGAAEGMYVLDKDNELPVARNSNFDTRVIIWHIATHLILVEMMTGSDVNQETMAATKMLSDYMVFLLVKDPDMLPGHTRRKVCMEGLKSLYQIGQQNHVEYNNLPNGIKIAKVLLARDRERGGNRRGEINKTCMRGARRAAILLGKRWPQSFLLDKIFRVWVEMLCYAGSHCSRDSHSRSLSSGTEFLTVVWLLAGHCADYERSRPAPPPTSGHLGGDRNSGSDEPLEDV